MKRSVPLTLVAVVLAASLGMASCGDSSSSNNPTDGDTDNNDQITDADNDNADTTDQEEAVIGGCLNNDMCPTGEACDMGTFECRATECAESSECVTTENPEMVCSDGLCYPTSCVTSADCTTAGYVCSGGSCVYREPVSSPDHVTLFAPSSVLRSGQTVTLVATAWNTNGAVITTDPSFFTWETSAETVATVAAGVATGAADSGAVTITAKWGTAADKMASVTLRNFGDVEAGKVRVVVYDIKSSEFLAGATVILNDTTQTTGQGADAGVAIFDAPAGAAVNIHVFAEGHDWISAYGVEGTDFVFPVEPTPDNTVSGGITGKLDFAPIPAIYRADIKAGIAGMAIEGNLLDIQFETLLGDSLKRHIQLSNLVNDDVALPGGIQLEIGVNQIAPEFYGFASEGPSVAWALGGYLPLQDVIDIASGALGEGSSIEDLPLGQIVAQVIPFLENFYHGVLPGLNITQYPKIVDANDLNGNDDTTDLIFDSSKFQNVASKLALAQRQIAQTHLTFGQFDIFADPAGTGAIVLAAAAVDGIGFVPLGLTVSLDENEAGVTDGQLDPVDMMFAPQHGGVEGYPYYFLALGASINGLIGGGGISLSAVIKRYPAGYPESMNITGFPRFPGYDHIVAGATASATTVQLDKAAGDTGANAAYRVVLSGDGQRWNIYVAPDTAYTLPEPPGTFAAGWDAVKPANIEDFQINTMTLGGGLTYSGLFQFNDKNLDQLNSLTDGFVLMFPKLPETPAR